MSYTGYNKYKDRVQVEKLRTTSHYYQAERVSGLAEDVMLYVADKLLQPVTPMYEHMAWRVTNLVVEQDGHRRKLVVDLHKSNYAGD